MSIQTAVSENAADARLDRPIFLVGHARAGSTALAAILSWHAQVGPKHAYHAECSGIDEFLSRTIKVESHIRFSEKQEKKDLWFQSFPGEGTCLHMGKELVVEKSPFSLPERDVFIQEMTRGFREERFFHKAPGNSFRVKVLREWFPDAKIVALFRRGEEVVASYGRRFYGFGKPFHWGDVHIDRLSYRRGIDIFARSWNETLDYLLSVRDELDYFPLTYDQLVDDTGQTLERLFEYLDLPIEPYIYDVRLKDRRSNWKTEIPLPYRLYLSAKVRRGNRILRRIEKEGEISQC